MTTTIEPQLLDSDTDVVARGDEVREVDAEDRAIGKARQEIPRSGRLSRDQEDELRRLDQRQTANDERREKLGVDGKKLCDARARKLARRYGREQRQLIGAIITHAGELQAALDKYEAFHVKVEALGDLPFGDRLYWPARHADATAAFIEAARVRGFA